MRGKIIHCVISASIAVCLTLKLVNAASIPATLPVANQPIMIGRETPVGAMNVFEHALETFDVATVADSYNLPEAARLVRAAGQVADMRFYRAVAARFGKDAAADVCRNCGIHINTPSREYAVDDWIYPPAQPDVANGKTLAGDMSSTPTMQKGNDGIWRIGSITPPRPVPPGLVAAMKATAVDLGKEYADVIADINAGKYATADDVARALNPRASRIAQVQAMQAEQKKQDEVQEQQFLAQKFDLSTLGGAVSAYLQAIQKEDSAALANCFFAKNDPDGRFARANAKRILSAMQLMQAIGAHVDKNYAMSLPTSFGLLSEPMSVWDFTDLKARGDRAVGAFGPGNKQAVWFQKVGGMWKQDITPNPPETSAERAEDMEEDSAAINRVVADIDLGKYKTLPDLRDALGAAMLNERPDPMFIQNGMRVEGEPQPTFHSRAPAEGPPVMNRNSPAGAMNTFIRALQNLDAAGLADSLYMPEDKNGSARHAAALEYIAGMRFLRAVESRFNAEDAQRICFACQVIQSYSLTQYADDQWVISTEYPDLAMDSGAAIETTTVVNGQTTTNSVMGWIPLMHRCNDGKWRIGNRFPDNSRRLRASAAAAVLKAALLEKTAAAISAGKYATPEDVVSAIAPSLPQ